VRSQIAFAAPVLHEWLRSPDLVCAHGWDRMTRH
jgi:hypothetical protein